MTKKTKSFASILALCAVLLVLGLCFGINLTLMMSRILIMTLLAYSLNIQVGYAGLGNLGHSLYFGLGSYGILICVARAGLPLWLAVVISLVGCTVLALVLGYLMLQTEGLLSFLFLSFGLCLLIRTLFAKWKFVGNTGGISFPVRPQWMISYKVVYVIIFIVVVLSIYLIYKLSKSPFIAMVEGSRENEERLRFLGVNIERLRLVTYVISSFFGIIAGILYAIMNNGAYITSVDTSMAMTALLMCLIGGSMSFWGPFVGAIIVTFITNFLPTLTSAYNIIFGIIIVLTCYFIPNGVTDPNGFFMKLFNRIRNWIIVKISPKNKGVSA